MGLAEGVVSGCTSDGISANKRLGKAMLVKL